MLRKATRYGMKIVIGGWHARWLQSPAIAARTLGSIRRKCLDHLIVFDEPSLMGHLEAYADYYHGTRTHLPWTKTVLNHVLRDRSKRAADCFDTGGWWSAPSLGA